MLEEWDEASGNRYQLCWRDIHVIDTAGLNIDEITFPTANDPFRAERAPFGNGRVGLSNYVGFLSIRCEVIQMTRHFASLNLTVGRLQKTEVVDAGKSCQ